MFYHLVAELSNGHGTQRRDIVSNNYASIECGAKVILTNKEANVCYCVKLLTIYSITESFP